MTDDLVERVRRNARGYDPGFDPTPLLNEVECELVWLRAALEEIRDCQGDEGAAVDCWLIAAKALGEQL